MPDDNGVQVIDVSDPTNIVAVKIQPSEYGTMLQIQLAGAAWALIHSH